MSGIISYTAFGGKSGVIGKTPYFKYRAAGTGTNANITANGEDQTLDFTTLILNTGGHYDGTNTFTAPQTGIYLFAISVMISLDDAHTYAQIKLKTSNFDAYETDLIRPYHIFSADSLLILNGTHTADMDAGDTAFVEIRLNDGGNTSDVTDNSYFMGKLLA